MKYNVVSQSNPLHFHKSGAIKTIIFMTS